MLRQRHINGDAKGRFGRLASACADLVRWPFERAVWVLERRLLWPLQRRSVGWSPPGQRAGAAALGAIAVAAILAAVLFLPSGGGTPQQQSAEPTRVAIVPPPEPQPQAGEPQEPTLHGVAPHFGVSGGESVAKSGDTGAANASGDSGTNAANSTSGAASGAATSGDEAAATASSAGKVVPAGPAAMKVARSFSNAFVFYEIGQKQAQAKGVFGETATEQLAEALDERPPRLPSNAKVPKAKVVNLVPGPRFGKQYTVSVSLLRVGVTSELRLTLQREDDGEWKVAQILG